MTETKLIEFLDFFAANGWTIERKTTRLCLNEAILKRYPTIPADFEMFLDYVAKATAPGEQAWFWDEAEYNAEHESDEFSPWWFEQFALECDADSPRPQPDRIKRFWDEHFPIALAVHGDYTCLSISVRPEDFGSVLHTMFLLHDEGEGGRKVSDSFEELLERMRFLIEKGKPGDEDWEVDVWDFV